MVGLGSEKPALGLRTKKKSTILFQPNINFAQSNISEGKSQEKNPSEETGSPFYDKNSPFSGSKKRTAKKALTYANPRDDAAWNFDPSKRQNIIEENEDMLLEEASPNAKSQKSNNRKSLIPDAWDQIVNKDKSLQNGNRKKGGPSPLTLTKDPHKFESRVTYNSGRQKGDHGNGGQGGEDSGSDWDFDS